MCFIRELGHRQALCKCLWKKKHRLIVFGAALSNELRSPSQVTIVAQLTHTNYLEFVGILRFTWRCNCNISHRLKENLLILFVTCSNFICNDTKKIPRHIGARNNFNGFCWVLTSRQCSIFIIIVVILKIKKCLNSVDFIKSSCQLYFVFTIADCKQLHFF